MTGGYFLIKWANMKHILAGIMNQVTKKYTRTLGLTISLREEKLWLWSLLVLLQNKT